MAGMRAALAAVLARFDPAQARGAADRERLDGGSLLPMNHKAKLWNLYEELYGEISREAETDFHFLFGEEFLRAYQAKARPRQRPRPDQRRAVAGARPACSSRVSVLSNPGGRERNEDACGFWTGDGGCFCVVSDGAGGHGGGDVASKLAVRVILASFQESPGLHRRGDRCARSPPRTARSSRSRAREDRSPACARRPRCSRSTPCTTRRCGGTSATRASIASATAASWRRPRTTASCRRWSTPATSRRTRCAQSLQRSRLFAALGHNEDFVATVERTPFPIAVGDVVPAVHGRLLGIHRRDCDGRGAGADAARRPTGCATWSATSCERGGSEQDNFSALAVWCSEAAPPRRGDAPNRGNRRPNGNEADRGTVDHRHANATRHRQTHRRIAIRLIFSRIRVQYSPFAPCAAFGYDKGPIVRDG